MNKDSATRTISVSKIIRSDNLCFCRTDLKQKQSIQGAIVEMDMKMYKWGMMIWLKCKYCINQPRKLYIHSMETYKENHHLIRFHTKSIAAWEHACISVNTLTSLYLQYIRYDKESVFTRMPIAILLSNSWKWLHRSNRLHLAEDCSRS